MRIMLAFLVLCATAPFASAQIGVAVSGIVQDQTGGLLPAATVDLVNAAGAVVQTTAADAAGKPIKP